MQMCTRALPEFSLIHVKAIHNYLHHIEEERGKVEVISNSYKEKVPQYIPAGTSSTLQVHIIRKVKLQKVGGAQCNRLSIIHVTFVGFRFHKEI